ncbi:hypothetical protein FNW02_11330 [Komarekiella sp. 'clone 1']|uniref:Uncharacterized protein n=1 Tax=Komarekiella delphini-convector SJRDD-AB1 TaxID=2593771 RepID=A0AA40VQW4_9NOST|nr:hypothetical protein [Komarekiella delphini-convector SJRDD-AB1]
MPDTLPELKPLKKEGNGIKVPLEPSKVPDTLPELKPLKKEGNGIKVPLFKGDLGGSTSLEYNTKKFSDILLYHLTLKMIQIRW